MLLAIDTAQAACSVGIWENDQLVSGHYEPMQRGHAEALFDRIANQLQAVQITYQNLTKILVTTGPGTFTGQRVGLAAARGLGLGLNIPVIGISTFEAIAAALINDGHGPDKCHVLFDARRAEIYHQKFNLSDNLMNEGSGGVTLSVADAQSEISDGILVGSGAHLIDQGLPIISGYDYPDASKFGWVCDHLPDGSQRLARPFYLRAPDAKPPKAPPPVRPGAPPAK